MPPEPTRQAEEDEGGAQVVEGSPDPVGPRRLWWPVSAALLAIAIGWALTYGSIDEDTLWRLQNQSNLGRVALRDGFSLAVVVVFVLVLAAVAWPRVAVAAVGVAGGVSLFFAAFAPFFLAGPTIDTRPYLAGAWFGLAWLGLAAVAAVIVEMWHRPLLRGQRWRRPAYLVTDAMVLLYVAAATDASFANTTILGDLVLLLALAARLRGGRWHRTMRPSTSLTWGLARPTRPRATSSS